jgi:hypothetical protein
MISGLFLMDVAPVAAGVGIFAGAAFFLVLAAVAFVAFRLLKKTAKLALRMTIAVLILLIAAIGSALIWWGSASVSRPARPPASRTR